MYLPPWLLVAFAIVAFLVYRSKVKAPKSDLIVDDPNVTPAELESRIQLQKQILFSLEHFDSPHFIDLQNAFDAMEVNYLRLKQRLSHTPDKVLEISKDWFNYVDALRSLKHAWVMLDVDMSDNSFENMHERCKEPSIVKEEIEAKFKSLLGDSWQEVPLDYHKRMETMDKPDAKFLEQKGHSETWKWYYRDSANFFTLEEKREKLEKEREDSKAS